MRIGIILEHSDPRRGGAEAFARGLAERLVAHGHAAVIASRTGEHARPVASFPAALRPRFYASAFLPWLRAQGCERVLTVPPVPGCEFFMPRNGILAASLPPRLEPLPAPLRAFKRCNPARALHFALRRSFEARAAAPPTRVLAISPRVVRDLATHHPGALPPLLLRSGVDLNRFHPAGARTRLAVRKALSIPQRPLLLFVGHNFALKGLATALRALALLPEAGLAVVGRGRPAPYRRLARRLGVAGRLFWQPDDRHLRALYRAAHLLVHPTHYDTASRVVLESLASGTPSVTTARDGNADLVLASGGEVLPHPGDADALAGAARRLCSVSRAESGARARAVAELCPEEPLLDRVVEAITSAMS